MLLNPSFFEGELTIAQAGAHTASEKAFEGELAVYVRKYERIFYEAIMGQSLYHQMLKGLGFEPVPDGTLQVKPGYIWLQREGQVDIVTVTLNYEVSDDKWKELARKTIREAAKFVWYYYMLDSGTTNTGSGIVEMRFESAVKKSAQPKMVRVWNDMLFYILPTTNWIVENKNDYPDFAPDKMLFAKYFTPDGRNVAEENLFGI